MFSIKLFSQPTVRMPAKKVSQAIGTISDTPSEYNPARSIQIAERKIAELSKGLEQKRARVVILEYDMQQENLTESEVRRIIRNKNVQKRIQDLEEGIQRYRDRIVVLSTRPAIPAIPAIVVPAPHAPFAQRMQ